MTRARARSAAETIDLVALRGGTGRPDIASLRSHFEARRESIEADPRRPFWWSRITPRRLEEARALLAGVETAMATLCAARSGTCPLAVLARHSVEALE